jgi:two-component system chemotaxis sensor kinase CheA
MGNFDDEVLQMYVEESREHLAGIETDLLSMEKRGADIDEEIVNKVFRAAHSLKGGAGFFGLVTIKELAHKIENVFAMIRSRELVPNAEIINILLLSFDKLRDLMNNPEESNNSDVSEFIVSLTGLASANLPVEKKETVRTNVDIRLPDGRTIMSVSQFDINHSQQEGEKVYLVEYDLIHDVHRMGKTPLDLLRQISERGTIIDCLVDISTVGTLDDEPSNKVPFFVLCGTVDESAMMAASIEIDSRNIHLLFPRETIPAEQKRPEEKKPAADPSGPSTQVSPPADPVETTPAILSRNGGQQAQPVPAGQPETSLRVNVGLLENLMNLAGELVLSRNQLLEAIAQSDQRVIKASGQRISLVTSELQEAIMLTRMQPIGNVFNKFLRVVRDMSRDLGKQVRLDITGSEVEMDKTIIEGLSDPLTHLVRNAVDHGIESPETRAKAGKSLPGVITLAAYHEAGQVNIEIRDDGKGIDPKVIASSAVAKGLVSAEQVKSMSEKEMMSLIFLPGLSTAEKVTDVSGRGVGMDVVKTNLNQLGGQVDITSEAGKGSTFRIKLPLTLAIIPCLLASVNKERFAIPQVNVRELIRIPAAQVKERIELVGDAEVLVLRGRLIPIIDLAGVLGMPAGLIDPGDGRQIHDRRRRIADRRSHASRPFADGMRPAESEGQQGASQGEERRADQERRYHAASDLNVIIVTTGTLEYGLVVEELHDSVEIVVKPMGRHLKSLTEYVGATIMGDGRVALILDVTGLAQLSALTSLSGTARATELAGEAEKEKYEDIHSFLTFWGGEKEQCAVPLDLVARVEQVKASDIAVLGGKRVMQYGDRIMPLFTLRDAADVSDLPENRDLVAVVFQVADREVGLLACPPVDAMEASLAIDGSTVRQPGIIGTSVVKGQTLLIVDVFELVGSVYPEWKQEKQRARADQGDGPAVLLVEDSDFFRQQVTRYIEDDGYRVIAGEDGVAAWTLLEEHASEVRIVITDIEMPRLDGYGLARKIKGDERFSHLPIIALTSLAGDEDVAKGRAAGIDDYQIKLDKEKLLEGITSFLRQSSQA